MPEPVASIRIVDTNPIREPRRIRPGDDMTIDAPTEAGRGPEAETDVGWEAPGPGSWSFDATHATRPFDRFTAAV
jgi:hypothetical protein